MPDLTYRRPAFEELTRRIEEPRRFIQVLSGPRQVGKTTLADQVANVVAMPVHHASADDPAGRDGTWLRAEWGAARRLTGTNGKIPALLVLDEIHKIPSWSDIVKSLWDEDTRSGSTLRVMVLGSSPLLLARGLTESLAGRFELTRLPHWSFTEMRQAFGWDDPDRYIFYGGFPGAAGLVDEPGRWRRYIQDSMIETTLSRDVLLLQPIQKPALLRQLFQLGCDYSSQELTFRNMTRQLEDAGSTVTLAHYLELLSGAGMLTGLRKFSGTKVVQRSSSPKLLVMNTALMSASQGRMFDEVRDAPELWGRHVESAVGAHLLAGIQDIDAELLYWRDGRHEVDFVVRHARQVLAIEVTGGRRKRSMEGMTAFMDRFGSHFEIQTLLVGGQGEDLADFLSRSVADLLGSR